MVYQIPRDGISNNAISSVKIEDGAVTTNKIGNLQVTLAKLSADAKRYATYQSTPITANVSLTNAQVNTFVFIGHSGTNPIVTIPIASDVNDGDWFTFVTNEDYDSFPNAAALTKYAQIKTTTGGGIDGLNTSDSIFIDTAFSSITLVSYEDIWRIVNVSPALVDYASGSPRVSDYLAGTEYASIQSTNGNVTAGPNSFISVTSEGQTVTLPSDPKSGDKVTINVAGEFVETLIARNGNQIMGLAEDMILDVPYATLTLIYVNSTVQWRIK